MNIHNVYCTVTVVGLVTPEAADVVALLETNRLETVREALLDGRQATRRSPHDADALLTHFNSSSSTESSTEKEQSATSR